MQKIIKFGKDIWNKLSNKNPFSRLFGKKTTEAQTVHEQILLRFENWLNETLSEGSHPEGIANELLSELKHDQTNISLSDRNCDLYSLFSSMTALTQEVKLQGRVFKQLADKVDLLLAMREPIEKVIETHVEALTEAQRIATKVPAGHAKHEVEMLSESKQRGRIEILTVLLDTRNRLVRGLQTSRESHKKLDDPQGSNWLRNVFGMQENRMSDMIEMVNSLEKGYTLGLDRLDDAIQRFGVREVPCVGLFFDPETMNVVDVEENSDLSDGMVLEVYRTGYMLNAEVIQPAQVKVVRSKGGKNNEY